MNDVVFNLAKEYKIQFLKPYITGLINLIPCVITALLAQKLNLLVDIFSVLTGNLINFILPNYLYISANNEFGGPKGFSYFNAKFLIFYGFVMTIFGLYSIYVEIIND
jgi:uncharacterized membrane protein